MSLEVLEISITLKLKKKKKAQTLNKHVRKGNA